MTDRKKTPNRWASLAEELGLETEPESSQTERPPSPPPAPPAARSEELPWAEPAEVEAVYEPEPELEPPAPVRRPPEREAPAPIRHEPELVEDIIEAGLEGEEAEPAEGQTEEGDSPAGEEGGKRRRRRRRRRRKGGPETAEPHEGGELPESKPLAVEPVKVAAPPKAEPEDTEAPSDRSRRGRGDRRGRKPPEPVAAEVDEPESEEVAQPQHAAEEDDDSPLDLSNWNVPSWTELIAGLYRPPDR